MNFLFTKLLDFSRAFYMACAVLYMAGIYLLSSLSFSFKDSSHPFLWSFCSNLFHFPLYMGLGFLLFFSFRRELPKNEKKIGARTIVFSLLTLVLYGAFDEWHQSWTGRTPSFFDCCVNLCGGLGALAILEFFMEKSLSPRSFIAFSACILLSTVGFVLVQVV